MNTIGRIYVVTQNQKRILIMDSYTFHKSKIWDDNLCDLQWLTKLVNVVNVNGVASAHTHATCLSLNAHSHGM